MLRAPLSPPHPETEPSMPWLGYTIFAITCNGPFRTYGARDVTSSWREAIRVRTDWATERIARITRFPLLLLLIALVRQHRKRRELDAFVVQRLGVFRRCDPIDRAVLGLAVVHLAGFLGKPRPDVLGILDKMVAQFPELLAKLLFLRRDHGDRRRHLRGGGGRGLPLPTLPRLRGTGMCRRRLLARRRISPPEPRRHQSLF